MGVRLYPIAKEGVELNKICDAIGVSDVEGFDLFGFGKFKSLNCQRDDDGYVSPCGEIRDLDVVVDLAVENMDFKADLTFGLIRLVKGGLIDGVYWC